VNAADARDRAVAFVGAHGDAFAIWRALNLAGDRCLDDIPLPDGVVQRGDGSFAHAHAHAPDARQPATGCAADTAMNWDALLAVVGALDDVRGLHLPLVERACVAVEASQRDDGGWDDGSSQAGDVYLTGMLTGYFGKTRFARAGMLAAAGAYLTARFSPERVQGFAWRAIAAYAHSFANVPHEAADGVLQWVGRELERGFRTGHFDGVRAARVLLYADASALPGCRLDAGELLEAILAEQSSDGGWLRLEDPSPAARVDQTLDALTAVTRFA
jgi:hypothetical protein